ncbi:retrovirus-related pol polyprotein from transposon TNT 1-94, partial [Tanacetum coccineum]
ADVSTSESAPMITSNFEDDSDIKELLSPLPKLTRADPSSDSKSLISLSDLTANMADLTLNTASKEIKKSSKKVSQTYVIKKRTESKLLAVQNSCPDRNALPSTEQLLLTLMEEVKGIKNQILFPSNTSSSVSQACSSKTPKQKVWYGPCKHYGMRNNLSNDCYSKPKCSTYGSISHTTKEHTEQIAVRKSLNKLKGQSTSKSTPVRTTKMSKTFGLLKEEPGPKVFFGDDSSGDTERYGLVNCNGITFTRVVYVNGLKHNLISISQLCDANFKESNACFLAKASPRVNWLWHKRLSHLNFKNINNLAKHNLVSGLPSLTFSKDKNCLACEKGKHHRASFKTKRSFSINKSLHILHMDLFGPIKPQTISHNQYTIVIVDEYSRYTWVFCLKKKSDAADCIMSFIRKMENLNEVRVKELRSDNGTEFRNHKLEKLCDEKAARTMLNSAKLPKQFWGEAVNTACYTQNRSIIVKRHGKTAYDVFRGRSPDISYFYVFGYPVHIHNHRDYLGKFDEKADDGFFLGYSPIAKAFRVFNIRRQEMEETVHVTFSKDDEAISQTSTEGDAINFNENRSFPDDEFIEPRTKDTQCSVNIEYFPYVFAYENITSVVFPILQNSVTSEEPPEFTIAGDLSTIHEPYHAESADILKSIESQDNVLSKTISDDQPAPVISPSPKVILQNLIPQDSWSREKHIKLVNIIGEPLAGITTRSKVRDSDAASEHECLYVNFLSEIEPKKLIDALEEEGWVIAMQEELNQFERNKMDVKSAFLNSKISEEVYVQQPPGFKSSEFPDHVCKLYKALYGLKQAPRAWYETLSTFLTQHKFVRVKCPMLPLNNLGLDESGVSVNETIFRGMIGSLMYLTASRLNI